jgi:hypothetical protein
MFLCIIVFFNDICDFYFLRFSLWLMLMMSFSWFGESQFINCELLSIPAVTVPAAEGMYGVIKSIRRAPNIGLFNQNLKG